MSHLANCFLFVQLIATLIHYPCTVALMGRADWSAFLELVCQPCKVMTETMGLMEGTRWEVAMGLIFTCKTSLKALQSCLGLWLALLGLVATPNSPIGRYNLLPASHPLPSTHPTPLPSHPPNPTPLPPTHPLIHAIHDIIVVVKKVAQNPAVLVSYYR